MRCYVCGSTRLTVDPAGYYQHGVRPDGGSMMCLDWDQKSVESTKAHSGYKADIYAAERAERAAK